MCKLLKLGIGGAYDTTQKAHVVFFSLFLFFSSRSTVSYTHLDVYKRQDEWPQDADVRETLLSFKIPEGM